MGFAERLFEEIADAAEELSVLREIVFPCHSYERQDSSTFFGRETGESPSSDECRVLHLGNPPPGEGIRGSQQLGLRSTAITESSVVRASPIPRQGFDRQFGAEIV